MTRAKLAEMKYYDKASLSYNRAKKLDTMTSCHEMTLKAQHAKNTKVSQGPNEENHIT